MSAPTKPTLGLGILAKNEAHRLEKCVKSVPFADEILIIDVESSDRTAEVGRSLGAKVLTEKDIGVRDLKQMVIEKLGTDWILVLDPDEWLDHDCQIEIQKLVANPESFSGFEVPRYNLFLGNYLKHGRGIDHPLRLFKRGDGKYTPMAPHERVVVTGSVGRLKNGMFHDTTPTINTRIAKIVYETDLELKRVPDLPPTLKQMFLDPIIYFTSFVIKKGAWRDGVPGLIQIALFSIQTFIMYAKFYEYHHSKKNKDTP